MLTVAEITDIVNEKIKDTNVFIVEIKISTSKIAVYIDRPEGMTIDVCSSISRHIYKHYEESGLIDNYDLEVSSPGMDQPMRVVQQYYKRVGTNIKVRTQGGAEKIGKLISADAKGIVLAEEIIFKDKNKKLTHIEEQAIPYTEIGEAKVVFKF